MEIDYLNEKYNLNFQETEDFETLAGLIINTTECIPEINTEIKIEDKSFTILQATETKIIKVKLEINNSEQKSIEDDKD